MDSTISSPDLASSTPLVSSEAPVFLPPGFTSSPPDFGGLSELPVFLPPGIKFSLPDFSASELSEFADNLFSRDAVRALASSDRPFVLLALLGDDSRLTGDRFNDVDSDITGPLLELIRVNAGDDDLISPADIEVSGNFSLQEFNLGIEGQPLLERFLLGSTTATDISFLESVDAFGDFSEDVIQNLLARLDNLSIDNA